MFGDAAAAAVREQERAEKYSHGAGDPKPPERLPFAAERNDVSLEERNDALTEHASRRDLVDQDSLAA